MVGQFRQQAFNLMEMMLVVTISAIIIVGGLRQYQGQAVQGNIEKIKANVVSMLDYTNRYWFETCEANWGVTGIAGSTASRQIQYRSTAPDSDFLSAEVMPSTLTGKITGEPYSTNAFKAEYGLLSGTVAGKTNKVPYIQVEIDFNKATADIIESIAAQTGGKKSGNTVMWQRIVQQSQDSNQNWILRSDLQRFKYFEDSSTVCTLGHAS